MGWCSVQAFAIVAAVAAGVAAPEHARAQSFQTAAPHAILMDYDTGTVLFEKAADDLTAPASMAKTMAVEVIFNVVSQGRLSLESEFVISENAWRKGGGSSG